MNDAEMMERTTPVELTKREAELVAEIQAAKDFIDKMMGSLNDHYVIFDRDWRYVYANDAAARTLGVSKEQLIGQLIWELFPAAVGNQFYQELHRARDGGEDFISEHYYAPTGTWFENHFYARTDGVAVLSIDITARKRAEEAKRQSDQMLAFALQSANMVAWEWDVASDLVTISNAGSHIYGTKSTYYSHEDSYKTVYPDDLEKHRAKVLLCGTRGIPYHSNYRIIHPDTGAINWVDEWGFALRNAEGAVTKLFGVAMESTERKETEERLEVIYQLSEAVNRAEDVSKSMIWRCQGLSVFSIFAALRFCSLTNKASCVFRPGARSLRNIETRLTANYPVSSMTPTQFRS